MYDLLFFLALVTVGYGAGTIAEKKHYRSIINREKAYLHLPAVTTKALSYADGEIASAYLVYGNVVISVDYFKRILAGLRNIFGGTVKSYESLIDRARRESILRMKEMAKDASIIINVRIETSAIGKTSRKNSVTCLEAIAYGTAISLEK
ncbi:MAG: heavy metal-binding domain-containing protein [Deltaproteobacteria bacterium]|nr:heavy metal-binding domain-containing protein [Deltaproteobacteria bacterium]